MSQVKDWDSMDNNATALAPPIKTSYSVLDARTYSEVMD